MNLKNKTVDELWDMLHWAEELIEIDFGNADHSSYEENVYRRDNIYKEIMGRKKNDYERAS